MKLITLILILALALALASCRTAPRFAYAPVKITVQGNKIHVQPLQKFKPMPDTTIQGYLIKRREGL